MVIYKKQGLTLVELVISVTIGLFIMLGIFNFARNTVKYQDDFSGRLTMLDELRKVITPMSTEIRQMQDSSVGAYALALAGQSQLVFYSDVIPNGYRERIRYWLDGDLLKKGITVPSGVPLIYDFTDEEEEVLVRNVTSLTFRYYNESYRGEGDAYLLEPFPTSDVRMIEIEISIDDNDKLPPNPLGTVSTFVQLRNLKDNY